MDSEETKDSYLYIGMSGREMTDTINNKFNDIDNKVKDINSELEIRIISDTIKYIKLEDGVINYSEDNETWHQLNVWGNIKGNLADQIDLNRALGDKVNLATFNNLSTTVSNNSESILDLSGNVGNINTDIDNIKNSINNPTTGILVRLDNIDTTLESKVSSSQIKAIRTLDGTQVDFTTDGTNWESIFDGTVSWGNITGNISNQSDLQQLFNSLNSSISDITSNINTLNSRVTTIENKLNNENPVVYMTETNYRNLSTKDNDTIYIVSPS